MKSLLHLGCGIRPIASVEGFDTIVNHDKVKHHDYVDVAHNLDVLPWPFEDASFDQITALDVMEHLKVDVQVWLDECWRILKPDGQLMLRLPAWDNPVSYRDPTHQRVWHPEGFHYWDKRMQLHKDYGSFYFADSNRWWEIERVERINPATPTGDLAFVLRKVTE
jgi:predicted SAM-dependent methyltransferase